MDRGGEIEKKVDEKDYYDCAGHDIAGLANQTSTAEGFSLSSISETIDQLTGVQIRLEPIVSTVEHLHFDGLVPGDQYVSQLSFA